MQKKKGLQKKVAAAKKPIGKKMQKVMESPESKALKEVMFCFALLSIVQLRKVDRFTY